jgi:nicotinamidase-related amidase
MNAGDSALLVVDVQERLLPVIADHQRLVWNIGRLIDAARLLDVSIAATEQYPSGLGLTVEPLRQRLLNAAPPIPAKLSFSCGGCPELFQTWKQQGRFKILVVGIETHVCVLQTVLDLIAAGFDVYVAVDAVGSRFPVDRTIALQRMETAGAIMTTTEMSMFEWCDCAGTPAFKQISQLARQSPPREPD